MTPSPLWCGHHCSLVQMAWGLTVWPQVVCPAANEVAVDVMRYSSFVYGRHLVIWKLNAYDKKRFSSPFFQVLKAKAEYHNACKTEKSYINQERNAAGDSTISPDAVRYKDYILIMILRCSYELEKNLFIIHVAYCLPIYYTSLVLASLLI